MPGLTTLAAAVIVLAARPPLTDLHGDPLPPGAVARLGTDAFRHPGGSVIAVAFSPDGKWVAGAGQGRSVVLWEAATGRPVKTFGNRHVYYDHDLAFSPDSKQLAVSWGNGGMDLFEIATGKVRRSGVKIPGKIQIQAPAFTAAGRLLMVFEGDGSPLAVYDALSGTKLGKDLKARGITRSAYSPAGNCLALVAWNKIVLVALDTGKELRTLEGHTQQVSSLSFSRDGKRLASAGADDTARLWDTATGKELRRFPMPATTTGLGSYLALSPDGRTLATAGWKDGRIRLLDATGGKELRRLDGPAAEPNCLAFSPDGRILAAGGRDSGLRLWHTATGKDWHADRPGHRRGVRALAFTPDGKALVSGGEDGSVRLWDVAGGKQRRAWAGMGGWVQGVAVSAEAVAATTDPRGRSGEEPVAKTFVWDLATGRERLRFEGQAAYYGTTQFSPDGRLLATRERGGIVCLRDAKTGRVVRRLDGHRGNVDGIAFNAGGLLAVTDGEGVHVWDLKTGRRREALEESRGNYYRIGFSPDGRTLAAVTNESVSLWDVDTRKRVRTLQVLRDDGKAELLSFAFSPDGRVLALSCFGIDHTERSVRFWEVATGRERFRITTPGGETNAIAFAPGGRLVATGNADTTVLVWDVDALPEPPAVAGPLSVRDLDRLWADLADRDAARAYRALRTLAASPRQTLPLLRRRLQPVPRPDAARIDRLLAELDSDDFAVREKASRELERWEDAPVEQFRRALKGSPSLELRRRLERLLQNLEQLDSSPERLRSVRAVEVLERMGTAEAEKMLRHLAGGAPGARRTEDARAALKRRTQERGP